LWVWCGEVVRMLIICVYALFGNLQEKEMGCVCELQIFGL
jgi:hypothetical protein